MINRKIPKTITDVYFGDNAFGNIYEKNKLYIELEDVEGTVKFNLVFGDGEYVATLFYLDTETGVFVREVIPDYLRDIILVDESGKMKVLL